MGADIIIPAIGIFAGYQALAIDKAYVLLGGDPERPMPHKYYDPICELLETLGYEGDWVSKIDDRDVADFMWIRGPWPVDFRGPRAHLDKEFFVRFGDD